MQERRIEKNSEEIITSLETGKNAALVKASKMGMWILVAIFMAYLVAFFFRNNVAILITDPNFTGVFGITADRAAQGMLLSISLLFVGIFAFFSGPVANRLGPRNAIGFGLIIWTGLMAIMGSVSSLIILLVCRALLGAFQPIIGPSTSKLVQAWFPVQKRAKANGIWSAGPLVAEIIAMPLITWTVAFAGWRGSFYLLMLIGIIPIIFSFLFIYNTPSEHPGISKKEAVYFRIKDQSIEESGKSAGGFGFLKKSTFWYSVSVLSLVNAVMWGIVGWMPTYFTTTLGFSFTTMGFISALPYLVGVASILLITPLMDKFDSRAIFTLLGLFGSSIMIFIAMNVSNTLAVIAIFCLATACIMPVTPSLYTIMQNITKPAEVANAHGFFVGISYVFASLFPYLMGTIFNYTGDLRYGFYLLVSIGVIAAFICIPLIKRRL